jgi:demethylmenaquinone methyltransferase/2-methoxy-6-polyprenyl-1,4-benzoquinol methylase
MPDLQLVKKVFKTVAPRYNLLNTVLSLGLDSYWRSVTVKHFADFLQNFEKNFQKVQNGNMIENEIEIIDLATGSGVLAFALADVLQNKKQKGIKEFKNISFAINGFDISEELLEVARNDYKKKNNKRKNFDEKIEISFNYGDALSLPLPDSSVNAITVAFGLRNFESRTKSYAEMLRVLKPGGKVFILEFSQPVGIMKPLFAIYRPIMPFIASIFGAKFADYKYLGDTIRAFPDAETLKNEITSAGFKETTFKRMSGGIVALHEATK